MYESVSAELGSKNSSVSFDPDFLLKPSFHQKEDKFALWEWMRDNSPIHRHTHTDFPVLYSVTRYEDVKRVYQNPMLFSSAQGVLIRTKQQGEDSGANLTLALTDPPKHKKLRNIARSWFSASYVKKIEEQVLTIVKKMIATAINRRQCDITQDITSPLTLAITCDILGVPESEHHNVLKWCHEAFTKGTPLINNTDFMIFMSEFMDYKRKNPGIDLASSIIAAYVDDRQLTEKEILLNFENLIGATENASLSLSSGILAFINFPEAKKLLKANPNLMPLAIEEMLRWASSASHSMRTVTRDTVMHDTYLPLGSKIVVWLPSANRDLRMFKDPYKFDITRVSNNHLALGFGEHFCIGNMLGKMQARVLLNEILDLNLTLDKEPTFLSSIHVNGPEALPIKLSTT